MQVLADALATHWNKLSRDKLYKKAVNRDPGMFRLRLVCLLPGTGVTKGQAVRGGAGGGAAHRGGARRAHPVPPQRPRQVHPTTARRYAINTRFWYNNETEYELSLKGVLFTDTGPYRGAMQACYHRYVMVTYHW